MKDFGAIRDSLLFCRPGMLDVYDVLVVFSVQEACCWHSKWTYDHDGQAIMTIRSRR